MAGEVGTLDEFEWRNINGERRIYCTTGDCDWWGTAWGSQYAVHNLRHHEEGSDIV